MDTELRAPVVGLTRITPPWDAGPAIGSVTRMSPFCASAMPSGSTKLGSPEGEALEG
ncbi:MAG: hypothetical protein LC790_18650 [Actinobacteria bacterium]|nr:hypothetical protein [Actinomycetota bacterium]